MQAKHVPPPAASADENDRTQHHPLNLPCAQDPADRLSVSLYEDRDVEFRVSYPNSSVPDMLIALSQDSLDLLETWLRERPRPAPKWTLVFYNKTKMLIQHGFEKRTEAQATGRRLKAETKRLCSQPPYPDNPPARFYTVQGKVNVTQEGGE